MISMPDLLDNAFYPVPLSTPLTFHLPGIMALVSSAEVLL